MTKLIEGTKVNYNGIDSEIEAVSKQFSTGTFKYKLKNIVNLLDFSEFFIKTDEIIEEIKELIDDVKENVKEIKDDINETIDDIENIIKENKPKSKKSK